MLKCPRMYRKSGLNRRVRFQVPLTGPSAGLGRFNQSDEEPASSEDSAVHSPRKQPKRRFTRKEKGNRKVSDANTQRSESCRREDDSEAQGAGTSAEKFVSGTGRVRRCTRTRRPVERFGYNEYMAHHYAYMARVAEVREPESYAEAAEDASWHWRRTKRGTWLTHRQV
jgi:hypothetical protein